MNTSTMDSGSNARGDSGGTFRGNLFVTMVGLAALALSASLVLGDAASAKAKFDETYGVAIRGVKSTRTSSDDAKLAIILRDAAKASTDEDYTILLLEQAYEFGKLHTDGMRAAADALQHLATIAPRRQLEAQEKLLALYEIVFRNAAGRPDKTVHRKAGTATTDLMVEIAQAKGRRAEYNAAVMLLRKATALSRSVAYSDRLDEINEMIRDMTPLAPIDSKVQSARRALARDPADKEAARTLTDLYLKDLDRPTSAKTYAEIVDDAATLELYELAGKPVDSLAAAEATRLARWYEGMAGQGTPIAKTNVLIRAKVYYARVLAQKAGDADATASMTKIDLSLAALKLDGDKVSELVKSRRDRLGITVAARPVKPVEPKPVPPVPPVPPKPVDPVKPADPVKPPVAPPAAPPVMAAEPEPKEVEPEYREEELTDEYWKKRKSIFDF